ncbi:MAG TPA: hypothetical protein VL527_15005, partial [Dongiaceae bacterium]|nr:hypothetical protein [Dongiaceae bacterium]
MAATEKSSRALWPKLLLLALLMGIGGMLFVELAVPAWDRRGTAKRHIIVRNLLQIDAVKQQWALDHGLTNAAQLDRTVTVADLAPYL